ncbi:MAG TPA: antitoxin Xre/MbcA/ParS toxin-binding domain-containing protein [Pedobacter sp.]|uniref:type II RES/Xre toxin-antitoxin system antitoxin n=1 Tax=Pedobacter sp. TaxID=1411316 RepID=UPI002BFD2BEA|nr:antitoxin Xre/MbcA/ParS toxin-binding domain-containing protein [Pedobacter sp.]HMI04851.1 antitoxin Xre/MbcA/ParS toxin-binding domain-containing protein [Pedobacter sp.]
MATRTITANSAEKNSRKDKPANAALDWLARSWSNFDKMASVKTGISKDSLVSFKQAINIDYDHLSVVLGTTKTTLHKKQGKDTFSPSISEKVIALMDVYSFGYQVFGDHDKFNKWVQTVNRALGNRIPLEVMDTIFGIDEVKSIIGRIQHGVYS